MLTPINAKIAREVQTLKHDDLSPKEKYSEISDGSTANREQGANLPAMKPGENTQLNPDLVKILKAYSIQDDIKLGAKNYSYVDSQVSTQLDRSLDQRDTNNAAYGIPTMTAKEKLVSSHYRIGECGEVCDITQQVLTDVLVSTKKINPTGEHYYLESSDQSSEDIYDPTWKQFLYRQYLDKEGDPLEGTSNEDIDRINNLPNIYIGTRSELRPTISNALELDINSKIVDDIYRNYGTDDTKKN